MKKIISLFICVILLATACLAFTSCDVVDYVRAIALLEAGKYEEAKAIFEELGDYGESEKYLAGFHYMPKSVTYHLTDREGVCDIVLGANNLVEKVSTERPDLSFVTVFTYDGEGNVIQQSASGSSMEDSYYNYTYDANGHLIKAIYTDVNGFVGMSEYFYDEEGKLTRQTYRDATEIWYVCEYTYNNQGQLILLTYEGTDGYSYTQDYTYDSNGNLVKEVYTNRDGTQEFSDYTYDANGNRVKAVYSDADGIFNTCDYTYDANGNAIKTVSTDADGTLQSTETQYVLVYIPFEIPAGTQFVFDGYFDML